jgi:hypothetical protein
MLPWAAAAPRLRERQHWLSVLVLGPARTFDSTSITLTKQAAQEDDS